MCHSWWIPYAYLSSRQKAFSPLTALLKGLQDFRSNDQTIMEFKYSPLNYEAHLPEVGPKLQLAYHFSHVMMAPFLFLSTVPSIPLEIWFGVRANWPRRSVFQGNRGYQATWTPGQIASWKELGPHSLVVTLVLERGRSEAQGQEITIIINICVDFLLSMSLSIKSHKNRIHKSHFIDGEAEIQRDSVTWQTSASKWWSRNLNWGSDSRAHSYNR